MDDDYVSLSFETNKDETFVIARNAGFVPLCVAARRQSHFARARRRESISCSVPWARVVHGARGAETEVDKQGKRSSETGRHVFAAPLKTTSAKLI